MAELSLKNISIETGHKTLVADASLQLNPGDLIALIGPNGAGKTSLIRGALGLEKLSAGSAAIDGQNTQSMSAASRARMVAYLPQIRPLAWPNQVRDVVALGRFTHGARLGNLTANDAQAVDGAMAQCDIAHLANRRADTLSGGESARMHCARAFAAGAPLLVADEPVAALDPRHQLQVMGLIARYVANGGGAMVVLHDIALAARYATQLIWMKEGRIAAAGTPEDTLTQARMADVFGVDARVTDGMVTLMEPL